MDVRQIDVVQWLSANTRLQLIKERPWFESAALLVAPFVLRTVYFCSVTFK